MLSLDDLPADLIVHDLSPLGEADKKRAIVEQQETINGFAGHTVFLMTRDARWKAGRVTVAGYDIDDTLTKAKVPTIPASTLSELRAGRGLQLRPYALTGRTQQLVDPLFLNHDGDPGFDEAYTELGAFRVTRPGEREHFLATAEHERQLVDVRSRVDSITDMLNERHRVILRANLGREHASLDSHAVFRRDDSLPEREDMEHVTGDIRTSVPLAGWEVKISGRNTFDIVPGGISKARAMEKILEQYGVPATQTAYMEDSSNGLDALQRYPEMLRCVVYGHNSRPELLDHADIVSIGTANALPLIRFLNQAKRAG